MSCQPVITLDIDWAPDYAIDFAANLAQGDEGGMTPLSELPPIPAEGSHAQDESVGGDNDVQ